VDEFNLVMRIVHVLSAVFLIGGLGFVLIGLTPATRLLDESLRASLIDTARRKFYKISHSAIALLLITGAYNWWANADLYRAADNKALVQALLGTKALLGVIIAAMLFAKSFGVIKPGSQLDSKVVVILGVVIVIMAGVIRHLRLEAMIGL
jgi:uncharacterized membrane protein